MWSAGFLQSQKKGRATKQKESKVSRNMHGAIIKHRKREGTHVPPLQTLSNHHHYRGIPAPIDINIVEFAFVHFSLLLYLLFLFSHFFSWLVVSCYLSQIHSCFSCHYLLSYVVNHSILFRGKEDHRLGHLINFRK